MKTNLSLTALTALALLGPPPARLRAAEQEGVALAIIYDTSGSMRDPVRDEAGRLTPKYLIANKALARVADQIQAFVTNNAGGAPRKIDAALFIFQGEHAREVMKLAPFDAASLKNWAAHFSNPNGSTPLGNALTAASRAVFASPLPRKHVLIITDGMNTVGSSPAEVLPHLKKRAEQQQTALSVHFIAFDVDAKLFDPVKKLGATVVAASNESQLNSQLQFILQRKILLEEEEPPKK
jgi:hypothetical protein